MPNIRNSAKAVIIEEGRLLLTVNIDSAGLFYLFPGGGQQFGEVLSDAVRRECIEEIGREVEVGELLHVREYIGANHEFAASDSDIHQVEYYFRCRLLPGGETGSGYHPDENQIGVEWVELNRLPDIRLYPASLAAILAGDRPAACYIGDTN